MNRDRRNRLAAIETKLREICEDISAVLAEETEAYENMPDAFQNGERGDAMQAAMDAMDNAHGYAEEAADYLVEVVTA